MRPLTLPPNVLRHFYAGGERIAALRGTAPQEHTPEEWIGAANTTFDGSRGLSALPDGTLVRDAIEADPEAFLGPEHVARFGADPALLVKLLDAGQRLPVHFHPDRAFAGARARPRPRQDRGVADRARRIPARPSGSASARGRASTRCADG